MNFSAAETKCSEYYHAGKQARESDAMIVERQAIGAILLTPAHEVLLMRIHEPGVENYFWWIAPGGGIESGETVKKP